MAQCRDLGNSCITGEGTMGLGQKAPSVTFTSCAMGKEVHALLLS